MKLQIFMGERFSRSSDDIIAGGELFKASSMIVNISHGADHPLLMEPTGLNFKEEKAEVSLTCSAKLSGKSERRNLTSVQIQ